MPSDLVKRLIKDFAVLQEALDTHLKEGVEIKVAIATVKNEQVWLRVIGLLILTAIVGLYLKR